MTSREKSSGAEAAYRRLKYLEDLALLFLVLWILVLPGWLGSTPEGKVILEEKAVRPARIDVNRAPWYEWMLLEGIGEARARSLVEFRDANGPFRSIEELKRVPHMPPGWVEKAKKYLAIEEK